MTKSLQLRTLRPTVSCVLNGRRIAVVLPAYNAEATLLRTVAELDREVIDEIVLVDDASTDQTIALAREIGLEPIRHERNLGYGGNQKTCYRRALELGADIIVMVHPDYQYTPLLVPAMASMIAYGTYDFVLGSRILAQDTVASGMPRYKYAANRILTHPPGRRGRCPPRRTVLPDPLRGRLVIDQPDQQHPLRARRAENVRPVPAQPKGAAAVRLP